MKTVNSVIAALALLFACSFAVQAQGDKEVKEKLEEKKPDFEVANIPRSEKAEKGDQESTVANSYIVMLKSEKFPPFTRGGRQFSSREQQAAEADKFEEREKRKIMTLAKAKYGVEESDIKAVFTGGFTGFAANIPDARARGFMDQSTSDSEIEWFVQDFEVSLDARLIEEIPAEALLAQSVPWGVAFTGWANNPNMNRWAWVLDTGIQSNHPDLNVMTDPLYAKSFISGQTFEDGEGHGTHVAGTIAARNNTIGVVGVAANAVVVPVKVLGNDGYSQFSSVLNGVNHVLKYGMPGDVMNLSLGGYGRNDARDAALVEAGKRGIFVSIAAGNGNAHADNYTPARTNGTNLYTVSAMDAYCKLTSFSNYGNPPVDYAAPGLDIISTYKGSAYASMQGTSMAAPHVAGILLANKGTMRMGGCCAGYLCTDKDSTKDRVAKR